jgi:DNA polymerase
MKTLEIDIETFSSTDLKKAGVYKYAESPDFEILLFGYSIDGGEIRVVDLASGENLPEEVLRALKYVEEINERYGKGSVEIKDEDILPV